MKRYGAMIALGVAVLSGVVAVILANKWLSDRAAAEKVVVRESVPITKIVVASRDLEVGARLTAESLTLTEWPSATVPRGAFEETGVLEGRVAVTRLKVGQPVLSAELAVPGSGAGLVATIKPGRRAMAIKVDEVVGVGGFILPNTCVDIIAVTCGKDKEKKAKTILEKIEVLAVAQETFTEEGKPRVVKTVTVEVNQKQAETLALKINTGSIHLVLRNPMDGEKPVPVVAGAAEKNLVPVLRPRLKTPKPRPFFVHIIRGSKAPETIQFRHVESEERIES